MQSAITIANAEADRILSRTWQIALAVGGLALVYFLVMLPRDITWVNVGQDGADYMIAAKYWRLAHSTGAPFYTVLADVWLRAVPIGTDWWRLALLSALFSAGTAALLYAATRNMLAPVLFLASGIVVSQSTIIEVYAATTFFIVAGWYLHTNRHRNWGYAAVGLGMAIHNLAGFMFLALLVADWQRQRRIPWQHVLVAIATSAPWYLYLVLANRQPYINIPGNNPLDWAHYFASQHGLMGGIAVMGSQWTLSEDFRERCWDAVRIILSLGPGLVLLVLGARQQILKGRYLLPIVAGLVTLYWFTFLDPRSYTYMMVATALVAVIMAQAKVPDWLRVITALYCLALMGFNVVWYDIGGSHLDSQHSAEAFRSSLARLEGDEYVWSGPRQWEAMTLQLYNFDHGTNFNPILLGPTPRATLADLETAASRGKLYRTEVTDAPNYQVRIVAAFPMQVWEDMKSQDLRNYQRK